MTERWKRTSPIPTDPVYTKTQSARSDRSDYNRKMKRNPIPSDPVYNNGDNFSETAPKPRLSSAALNIARLHQGGALAQIFNPAFRIIPIGTRPR